MTVGEPSLYHWMVAAGFPPLAAQVSVTDSPSAIGISKPVTVKVSIGPEMMKTGVTKCVALFFS